MVCKPSMTSDKYDADKINLFNNFEQHKLKLYALNADFTNWESGLENIGCLGSGCTEYDGITVVSKSNFAWNAVDKSQELPYICMSQCPVHFIWYPGTHSVIENPVHYCKNF